MALQPSLPGVSPAGRNPAKPGSDHMIRGSVGSVGLLISVILPAFLLGLRPSLSVDN